MTRRVVRFMVLLAAGFAGIPRVTGVSLDEPPIPLRPVRVLVAEGLAQASIRSTGPIQIRDTTGALLFSASDASAGEMILRPAPRGLAIADRTVPQGDVYIDAGRETITLVTAGENGSIESVFPGRLRVIGDQTLLIINEVDLEDYVASVVAGEVWPSFDDEALRAQAIVTRTFVLHHMLRRSSALYDVIATQGSQVYRGLRTDTIGRQARQAAEYTRGVVSTWNDQGRDRIFCAYYSAACGGMSQPAAPLGPEGDIPPLAGGVRCDYCRIAPGQTYRWGPVHIGLREVRERLLERYAEVAALGAIHSIEPVELTRFGRPLTWRITGTSGESMDIVAERFRLAVGPNLIRSTDCNVKIEGDSMVFTDGKGFGHGLGLCQWGMQGQAREGKKAAQILRYYFPGSRLIRVY